MEISRVVDAERWIVDLKGCLEAINESEDPEETRRAIAAQVLLGKPLEPGFSQYYQSRLSLAVQLLFRESELLSRPCSEQGQPAFRLQKERESSREIPDSILLGLYSACDLLSDLMSSELMARAVLIQAEKYVARNNQGGKA